MTPDQEASWVTRIDHVLTGVILAAGAACVLFVFGLIRSRSNLDLACEKACGARRVLSCETVVLQEHKRDLRGVALCASGEDGSEIEMKEVER